MAKLEIPGIRIRYNDFADGFTAAFSVDLKKKSKGTQFSRRSIEDILKARKGKKSKPAQFISNDSIRKAANALIKETSSKHPIYLGYMRLDFYPETGMAKWETYSPFMDKAKKFFPDKGIANYLELLAIKEMKRRFPSLKKVCS